MTKATGVTLIIASVIVFLVSLVPFVTFSIAGVIFAIYLFALGCVMVNKGNKPYCEWVRDEDIADWDWDNPNPPTGEESDDEVSR